MERLAFVTGATGFVGRHLVERLRDRGWRIRALVRSPARAEALRAGGVELVPGDLADDDALRRGCEGADAVFHLAAVTGLRGELDFGAANERGTENLVEAVRKAHASPRRFVYLSSYAACGPSGDQARRAEEPPSPLTAYGRTKLAGERIARQLAGGGAEVVIVRAPTVYGPGDAALLPYFRLVRARLAPVPGDAGRLLHVIYVADLARAVERAAHAAQAGTYAVAEPVEHSWRDLIGAMARAVGVRPLRVELPAAAVRATAAATECVARILGRPAAFTREKAEEMLAAAWVCELNGAEALLPHPEVTPLATGMKQTVEWYRRQGWL